jgi:hypothetical protein
MFNYKLLLPKEIYIYLIFYILLFELILKDTIIITLRLKIKVYKEEYKVKTILNKK